MQNHSFIEFKKERDLGAIINDTFAFIRENWKSFFGAVLKIAGPYILIGAILMVILVGYYLNLIGEMAYITQTGNPEDVFRFIMPMYGWIFLLGLVFLMVYIIVSLTALLYIKFYISNNGEVNVSEIRKVVYQNLLKYLGLVFLVAIMVLVGSFLCLFPGIYLAIVLSLSASIMVFENKGISDSISQSFVLIKEQWWSTFGVMLVVGILVNILGYAFSVPALIYQLISGATSLGSSDPTEMVWMMDDPINVGLNILSYIGQFLLSSITLVSSVFIYYDLNEQKNLTGTIEKIDSLGQ